MNDITEAADRAGEGTGGLSRRQFLRGAGTTAAATALVGAPAPLPAAPPAGGAGPGVTGIGPGPVKVTLTVNGRPMSNSVEPRVTLLDFLRNYLDVTGCKRVC
ncbi:MAG: twin-arginine translocation signal domain-containing protein, partial [Gemmataceae bacterium]|nr:twin-arginine translocation signal domain-containing protein [Gemmataceae bacterium]